MGVIGSWDSDCYPFIAATPSTTSFFYKHGVYSRGRTDYYAAASTTGIAGVAVASAGNRVFSVTLLPAIFSGYPLSCSAAYGGYTGIGR